MKTYQKSILNTGQFILLTFLFVAWQQLASAKAQTSDNQTITQEEVLGGNTPGDGEDSLKKNVTHPDRKSEKIKAKSIGKVKFEGKKQQTKFKSIWMPLALPVNKNLFY